MEVIYQETRLYGTFMIYSLIFFSTNSCQIERPIDGNYHNWVAAIKKKTKSVSVKNIGRNKRNERKRERKNNDRDVAGQKPLEPEKVNGKNGG